jgi:hypothetical protein
VKAFGSKVSLNTICRVRWMAQSGRLILDRLDSTTQLLMWANNCVGLQQRR